MLKSILDAILMPTWLHFGSIFQVLGHLGGILGRLGGVLGRLGALSGRFGTILEASWAVLGAPMNKGILESAKATPR